ncbi:MAG: hypothetical protein Q8Q20_05410 [bacterium]|nr:hypothetical protein [bacterium]
MLETSQDVLYLTIAAAVAAVTFFLCWSLYYMISILRTVKKTVTDVRDKVQMLDGIFKRLKDTVASSGNYLSLLVKSVVSLVEFFKDRKEDKKNSKKK